MGKLAVITTDKQGVQEDLYPITLPQGVIDDKDKRPLSKDLHKIKNKEHEPTNFSGLGRVYLEKNVKEGKNILTQEMINKSNTIYIIEYDFDLNGNEIAIPEGCVLDFQGGSFSNGMIVGNKTCILASLDKIFGLDIVLSNDWNISYMYPEWFGAKGNKTDDDIDYIQKCIDLGLNLWIPTFLSKHYHISKPIIFNNPVSGNYYPKYYDIQGNGISSISSDGFTFTSSLDYDGTPNSQYLRLRKIVFNSNPLNVLFDNNKLMRLDIGDCDIFQRIFEAFKYLQSIYIHDCKISRYSGSCIYCGRGLHNVIVDKCQVERSFGSFLTVYGSDDGYPICNLSVTNTLIESVVGAAIEYSKVSSILVSGCYFENNKGGHVVAKDFTGGITLIGNRFSTIYEDEEIIDNTGGSGTYKVVWWGADGCVSIGNQGLQSDGNKGHFFRGGARGSIFINDIECGANSLNRGENNIILDKSLGGRPGMMNFNTNLNKLIVFNGTEWVNTDGSSL